MHKEHRLARREDFNRVYRYGKSTANQQFVVYVLPKPQNECFRVGVSVSKKLGNAVVRNRLRRTMKEIVRLHKEQIADKVDFVLIARKPVADMEYEEMRKSLLHVLKRASLIKGGPSKGSN
ncbi:ribonuclease P protein component [Gorillibacterium massiliense]|uniref:ribonuclease P protein component n=1 Tax=Gorillibacterium massiliense TaxID=1280390 RepID=UPI0004B718B7|nr:ribonuclease P protein component [Gorillibacterium massiliense]